MRHLKQTMHSPERAGQVAAGAAAAYADAREWLFSLKAGGVKFGIDRMRQFAAALGNPERKVPMVHVAGTNGKGSVSAMLESILRGAGLRTGLYTSPHLVRLGERVQVDRVLLSGRAIVDYVGELKPIVERLGRLDAEGRPSFFELMTGMAFLEFFRRACDVGIIETGLGGRLDATNILEAPRVSVITSIGVDHCEFLGNEIGSIAREKAGIIKTGGRVVLGRMPAEAEEVIRRLAAERGAEVRSVREEFGENLENYPETNLGGDFQRWNAATALLAAACLRLEKFEFLRERALAALQGVEWAGRWQRVELDGGLLVLDAAHNAEGAAVLDENLRQLVERTGERPVVVTGVLGGERARALLAVVARWAGEIILVVPNQERACGFAEMEKILEESGTKVKVRRGRVEDLFAHGVCRVTAACRVPVVVTGSIYLLGEVLALLEPERGAGEGLLQDF